MVHVSRDQRDPLVQKVKRILAQVNTKDSGKV